MKENPKTYHDGADAERKAWMRKIQRLKKAYPIYSDAWSVLDKLDFFGRSRVTRNKKKAGGL